MPWRHSIYGKKTWFLSVGVGGQRCLNPSDSNRDATSCLGGWILSDCVDSVDEIASPEAVSECGAISGGSSQVSACRVLNLVPCHNLDCLQSRCRESGAEQSRAEQSRGGPAFSPLYSLLWPPFCLESPSFHSSLSLSLALHLHCIGTNKSCRAILANRCSLFSRSPLLFRFLPSLLLRV